MGYNTRGMGHSSSRKEFDEMYNRGYIWSDVIDTLVLASLKKTERLNLSKHISERISNDFYGNRLFSPNDITLDNIRKGQVVEVEFQYEDYEGDDFMCLKKAVVRLPKREDGEQVCVVCQFNYNGTVLARTAWLNNMNDNHQTGLDTSEFSWRIEGEMFGFFHKGWTSRVWKIHDGEAKELKPNVAMTFEEYNRRNGN